MSLRMVLPCVLGAMLSLAAHAAGAAEREDRPGRPDREVQELVPRQQISREQAAALAGSRYSGRILSVRLEGDRWRVRMDNQGTVFDVFVDARSGQVSGPAR